ncbi:metastasis-associated protein MTA3 isoform X2 [Toxorhynchites rutilus septentrionalis]|uniref:metastasis-associated protein MTA3 isoform X2 n=1 Tax=Toxorhynchites rutilus septentrionalis TaxID=329112 RepID=UPI002479776C|nr:metastasis-associated protein MTA3 isoform X2 [Toxorhynchites rutilus septentrionalis]
MTTNMYRVGDYVYVETSSTSPYQIRRIDELNKTPNGNVEAKVMCFYRRRDLPTPLVQLADKHQMATSEDSPVAMKLKKLWLKTPVGEEQAAQAVLDPALVALEEERNSPNSNSGGSDRSEQLNPKQRHQMKHRELFLSRQVETLPATQIRAKCSVTLLNEEESLLSYLNKDDTFFYCLVFDPTQKTLLADKGEIRVGNRYQTELQSLLKDGEKYERNLEDMETLVWTPNHALSDKKIDQFLVVSRSVGTFARALDCTSSVKQPSLHMSAAAASRDITLFHAMDTLHKHNYSIEDAMCSLVPSSGPVLCRDEMEEWSASEANLFEDALEKYGKDFNDIRNDFLPWKTLKSIVEYYYMWKTTDRYVQQKRVKAVEAESKLKQVYIPNYTKPSPALITNNNKSILNGNSNGSSGVEVLTISGGKPCESCSTSASLQWYSWGPSHLSCRLCQNCWNYWKRYGGLKVASRLADSGDIDTTTAALGGPGGTPGAVSLKKQRVGTGTEPGSAGSDIDDDLTIVASSGPIGSLGVTTGGMSNHRPHSPSFKCSIVNCGKEFKLKVHLARHYAQAHGIQIRSGSPRPIMKTRTAFYLHTTLTTRVSRRLCRHIIRSKKAARQPSYAVNVAVVKQEFATAEAGKSIADIRRLLTYKKRDRGSVTHIANRLGNPGPTVGDWLILTPKDKMPKPEVVAFPKPPKAPDGSLLYERIPNKPEAEKIPLNPPPAVVMTTSSGGTGTTTVGVPIVSMNAIGGPAALSVTPAVTVAPAGIPTLGSTAGVTTGRNTPNAATTIIVGSTNTPTSLKRRHYEDANGIDGPIVIPAKRPNKDPMPSHRPTPEQYAAMMAAAQASGQPLPRHHMNGKPKIAQLARTGSGRKQVISWMDAPDDVYYRSTKASRKTRRKIPITELRRSARKPWRNLHPKYAAIIATLLPPVPPVSAATAAAVAAAAAAAAAGIPSQPPTTLPPQLTAQLNATGQLPHSAVAANLNLNLNTSIAATAALAGVHPLAAQLATSNSKNISSSTSINISSSSNNKANSDLQVVILD